MKYIYQALVIAAVTFAAELLKFILPFPFPASIYGLIILFTLLKSGILKLSQVEDVGGLLLELMPLLLVPTSVSFITSLDAVQRRTALQKRCSQQGDGFRKYLKAKKAPC